MEMHHASKTILKLFTPFSPRQLSCERTYARLHPAEGAGAQSFAGFPGDRTGWFSPAADDGELFSSPQQQMMGVVLLPTAADGGEVCSPPHICAAGRAVPICSQGMWRGAGRWETSPPSLFSRIQSPAATKQQSSFCRELLGIFPLPQVQQWDVGTGASPALGRDRWAWLAGWMCRIHREEQGCLEACT